MTIHTTRHEVIDRHGRTRLRGFAIVHAVRDRNRSGPAVYFESEDMAERYRLHRAALTGGDYTRQRLELTPAE